MDYLKIRTSYLCHWGVNGMKWGQRRKIFGPTQETRYINQGTRKGKNIGAVAGATVGLAGGLALAGAGFNKTATTKHKDGSKTKDFNKVTSKHIAAGAMLVAAVTATGLGLGRLIGGSFGKHTSEAVIADHGQQKALSILNDTTKSDMRTEYNDNKQIINYNSKLDKQQAKRDAELRLTKKKLNEKYKR